MAAFVESGVGREGVQWVEKGVVTWATRKKHRESGM